MKGSHAADVFIPHHHLYYLLSEQQMILPYRMETAFARYPYTNAAIIAFTSIFYFFVQFQVIPAETAEAFVLQEWNVGQMAGNLLMHGGIIHLVGNMLFLWIFGNAVCALVGNVSYFFVYTFLGICASAAHLFFNGNPAIGASGAINGIVGMTLILFPVNRLHNVYFFTWPFSFPHLFKGGRFVLKAYWMILFWFVFDIFGLLGAEEGIAYWAHIGGFGTGIIMAVLLVKLKTFETYDATLFDVIEGNTGERDQTTFEELEELNARKKSRLAQSETSLLTLDDAITQNFLDPAPVLRILNVAHKNNDVICYFINDGDSVSNVTIRTPQMEIQPSQLEKRTSGWMRLPQNSGFKIEELQFDLSFVSGEHTVTKQMVFDVEGKKFIATS